jgi:hypothetical protein
MATIPEIAVSLDKLFDAMPAPRGIDPEKAFNGYVAALSGFAVEYIDEAIRRYLSAEFPKISLKFYPRAPELASIVRLVRAEHMAEGEKVRRALERQREAAELSESEALRHHTPEQKARVTAAYDGYLKATFGQQDADRRAERERQRAEVRARYGMTAEVLAGVKDRPLPAGMAPAGASLPGVPVPDDESLPMFADSGL